MFRFLVWQPSLMQCSSTQSHSLSSSFTFETSWPLIWTEEKKGVFMFPLHRVTSELFCCVFRKSCKDFYIMKSDGAIYNKCHETMILLQAIYFCTLLNVFMQYHWYKYCCKSKALFSPHRSPPQSVLSDSLTCGDSKCFQCMPAFTIWYFASNDDGKCYRSTGDKQAIFGSVFVLLKHSIWEYCLSFSGLFFLHSVTTYIRVSVSHALRGTESDFLMDCLN